MKKKTTKLILTGSIAFDRIMLFAGKFSDVIHPKKLNVLSISLLIDELRVTRGGTAANIAYSLALLGEKPILFGSVGDDAKMYMKQLARNGVDISHVYYSHLPTASFTVMTDVQNCQVGGFHFGAMADSKSLSLKKFPADEYTIIVITPHDPIQMARQVKECVTQKRRLFYDVGQQASNISADDLRAGVAATEILIVNEYEMHAIVKKTGWSEKKIKEMARVSIVTLGEKGCAVFSKKQKWLVPAIQVKKVIEPTGAGDAFRAGFLYGYIRDYSPQVCAQLGVTAAAYAVEQFGTQEHLFSKKEFLQRYAKHFGHLK